MMTKAIFTLYRIVKRSVTESVLDRASVHTTEHCLRSSRELQIHNEYDDEYEKVSVMLRTLQTNSVILCILNGCSVLAARKSLQSVTNELDKLKL